MSICDPSLPPESMGATHARAGALDSTTMLVLALVGAIAIIVIAYLAYRQMRNIKDMDRKIGQLEQEIEERKNNPEYKTRCPRCKKVLEIPRSGRRAIRFKCPKCSSVVSVKNPRKDDVESGRDQGSSGKKRRKDD
jgi:hypothetical protein